MYVYMLYIIYYISTFDYVSTIINFWSFLVLPKIIQLIQVSVGCQKKLVASDLSVNPDGLSHSPNFRVISQDNLMEVGENWVNIYQAS